MTVDEWAEAFRKAVKAASQEVVENELGEIARAARKLLVDSIRQQRWPMEKLSDRWAAKKKKEKLDPRKLIGSELYIQGILVRKYTTNSWIIEPSSAPVKPYKFQKRAPKITYQELAKIHEYGFPSKNIPARPHWGPLRQEYDQQGAKIARTLQRAFRVRLNTKVAGIR